MLHRLVLVFAILLVSFNVMRFATAQDGDRDGDGVPDSADACPDQFGPRDNRGCPIDPDTDGDGLPDSVDSCPREVGPRDNGGCPVVVSDSDGDGVPDSTDRCPRQFGPRDNDGCPVPVAMPSDTPVPTTVTLPTPVTPVVVPPLVNTPVVNVPVVIQPQVPTVAVTVEALQPAKLPPQPGPMITPQIPIATIKVVATPPFKSPVIAATAPCSVTPLKYAVYKYKEPKLSSAFALLPPFQILEVDYSVYATENPPVNQVWFHIKTGGWVISSDFAIGGNCFMTKENVLNRIAPDGGCVLTAFNYFNAPQTIPVLKEPKKNSAMVSAVMNPILWTVLTYVKNVPENTTYYYVAGKIGQLQGWVAKTDFVFVGGDCTPPNLTKINTTFSPDKTCMLATFGKEASVFETPLAADMVVTKNPVGKLSAGVLYTYDKVEIVNTVFGFRAWYHVLQPKGWVVNSQVFATACKGAAQGGADMKNSLADNSGKVPVIPKPGSNYP